MPLHWSRHQTYFIIKNPDGIVPVINRCGGLRLTRPPLNRRTSFCFDYGYPQSLTLQEGGNRVDPDELTQVSDPVSESSQRPCNVKNKGYQQYIQYSEKLEVCDETYSFKHHH